MASWILIFSLFIGLTVAQTSSASSQTPPTILLSLPTVLGPGSPGPEGISVPTVAVQPVAPSQPSPLPAIASQPSVSASTVSTKKAKNTKKSALNKIDLPAFLLLAGESERKAFVDLATNPNVQKGIKATAMQAWATKCGANVSAAYTAFLAEKNATQQQQQAAITQAVASLSDSAKEVHAKIEAVKGDTNLTSTEEANKLNKIKKKAKTEVWTELTGAMDQALYA
ncbi:unnamed protein product, partial [Mesorhabditis spiculigera]